MQTPLQTLRIPPERRFTVRALSLGSTKGWLTCGNLYLPCALGRSGRGAVKREGDGRTPVGHWPMRAVLYRADRGNRPRTRLPVFTIGPDDGWCDAPGDRNYNRFVPLPYPASAERLWREDHLYDIVVVLGHNDLPRIKGGGSAIFMHLARPGYQPTEGCIALKRRDLEHVLTLSGPGDIVEVLG